MRPVSWLHISDFHLRDSQAWEQDVVLSAMCKDIERQSARAGTIDFVLATGDLAFAGKAGEYERAGVFFDGVARIAGVPRERIFCIPGNHDVDRDRQKMCFAGARHVLQCENEIDSFLGSPEEVTTLLERQEHYCRFQESCFATQERVWTADRLGYVSLVTVEDLCIAIVGLNTAWLAEGGLSDHGRLLAGERQVINALRIADEARPHVVITMGHHPFRVLNEFDARPVQRRIEEACQFFHCGHLHDPEVHDAIRAGGHCLTVAAGASFESRHSHNSYSLVCLDVMRAVRAVKTIQYKPTDGAFSYESDATFPFIINSEITCGTGDLGQAIEAYRPALSPVAYYLAALLLEVQVEVPIAARGSYVFGSLELLTDRPDGDFKTAALAFMALRNPLRLFAANMPLAAFLVRYGDAVERFGTLLIETCARDASLHDRVEDREADARALAGTEPVRPFTHTLALLRELATEKEWKLLQEQAERYLDAAEEEVGLEARRMLALSLAQSEDVADRQRAAAMYCSLTDEGIAQASDIAAQASLLLGMDDYYNAKKAVLTGIERFHEAADGYLSIGQAIVEASGDRDFRDKLSARRAGRRRS